MLKALVLLFVVLGFLYFLFYPWLRHSIGRKKFFKWFLILYAAVAVASTLGKFLLN